MLAVVPAAVAGDFGLRNLSASARRWVKWLSVAGGSLMRVEGVRTVDLRR